MVVLIKVPIQKFLEVFSYVNVRVFTEWRLNQDDFLFLLVPRLLE